MKAKPYLNLCRNRIILEQMSGPEGRSRTYQGTANQEINMRVATNAAKFNRERSETEIPKLVVKHGDTAYEEGIKKYGHWDLTREDSEEIIGPHFDNLKREALMIDPKLDVEQLRKDHDDHVTERARRLHSGETMKAKGRLATLGGAVSRGISRMIGLGEELEGPVGAAVSRVMDTIGEMHKSERRDANAKQVAMIVNAVGKRLPEEHHDAFKKEVMKRIQELG